MKLLSGLSNNAGTLGLLAGLLTEDKFDLLISSIQQAMAGVVHAPNPDQVQYWVQTDGKNALMAYLAGLVMDAVPIGTIQKFAKPLQKGAIGYATATGAIRVLYGMTHSEIKGTNILNSKGLQNIRNAPTTQQAQMMYY